MTSQGTEAKGKYSLFTLLYLLDFEPYEFLEKIKMSQNESKKFKQTITTGSVFSSGGRINIPRILFILQSINERGTWPISPN